MENPFLKAYFLVSVILLLSSKGISIRTSGPGLGADIIMPGRYFFIELDSDMSVGTDLKIVINGTNKFNKPCRIWTEVLDRKDNFVIVRYKLYEICTNLEISSFGKILHTDVLPDDCMCPKNEINEFLDTWKCGPVPKLLEKQVKVFGEVDWDKKRPEVIKAFDKPLSVSLCHYVIKNNKIFRKCYGKYVDFKMFVDKTLLSLVRKSKLPDVEFFMNLGDWPLSTKEVKYPIFSWCGSTDSYDIILPTYELTDSVLENMGRVSVNTLSVQGNVEGPWESRIPKLFWRGRDSNKNRLKLIEIARNHPDLFNVSLTNFFFYKDKENIYGPKSDHVSFYKFFDGVAFNNVDKPSLLVQWDILCSKFNVVGTKDHTRAIYRYKYQLAIDGTVAPYRMPFLLAGGSLIFKPESKYFEHFYRDIKPYVHYIPVAEDLSDLVEKIGWARENDEKAKEIAKNGQNFANEQISPVDIYCYHMHVLNEFSKVITSPIRVLEGMEEVNQEKLQDCGCGSKRDTKEEL